MNEEPYKETHKTWNKLALLYQEKFMDLDIYNSTYDKFIEMLPSEGGSLLEVGCGPGNITRYLLKKRPGLKILATDVSPEMVKLASQNNPTAKCRVMDARDLSSIQNKFDGMVIGFCIPYLSKDDTLKMLQEANALLGKSGVLYVSALMGDYEQSGYEAGSAGRVLIYYYSPSLLKEILNTAGFTFLYMDLISYERRNNTETHIVIIVKK